jgi:hypothetical protein
MDDIIFESAYFFFEMPVAAGSVAAFEADSSYYTLRLALPERISIG